MFLIAVAFVRMLAGETCDVLVVGGGAAGIAAALQAGRSGASVILVERGFQVGGNMTTGGVNFPGLFHAWGRQVIDGCAYEVLTNAVVLSGEILPDFAKKPQRHWMHQLRMDIPVYVALAEEALVKAGVRLRYHTVPMDAVRTGDCWFLKVVSDGVVDDISATVLIDCTGDGTLAEMAGARRVRESETSPGSFMYDFANGRELWARCDRKLLEDAFRGAIASGELHTCDATFGLAGIFEHVPGTSWNYLPGADASTAEKRADTNRRARESMLRVYRFLKRQPGFGNLRLGAVSPEAAVRETWRVEGDYVITADDYVSGRTFEDGVCHAFYPVDLHSATDGVAPKQLKVGVVPSVPFRALCAKGVPNLLVAGRCVSGDRLAVSGLRVQAACMATGQAAGEAAALAASRKCDVRDVSVDELRRRLSASGAIVPSRFSAEAKDRVQVHSVVTDGMPDSVFSPSADYDEPQRAQFHFTPQRGWMNDPNGLCFYKGEWHLFYQANPDGLDWGRMRWGHAVSPDLVHWRQLDVAMEPDEFGTVFSGSAVVDRTNAAGFGQDELLLFYTAAGKEFTQRMAHSSDGRTVVKVPGKPILPAQGKQNRDPHVFRYHDGRWVMVLYVPTQSRHAFNIYNSADLRNWKLASVFTGPTFEEIDFYDWELPQLFELPVRGTDSRRWVLMGASGSYAVGQFDGAEFVPEARNLPPVVKAEPGGNWPKPNWPKFGYNSSLVFAGNDDGRTILMSWYHLFTKGEAFTQAAGLPLEVTLEPTQDGPRLAYFPVRELAKLRAGEAVPLERFEGELLEAEVECRVAPGARVSYSFRGIPVVYDRNLGLLTVAGESVPWRTAYGHLKLHVFQDRIGIEVFDPNGLQAFVQPKAVPSRDNLSLALRTEGEVTDCRSSVWRLNSIHRFSAEAKDRVQVHSVVTNGVEVRWFEEMVPMRDGVRLYTVGLLPPVGEKRPIIFEKTPYDNAQRLPDAFAWAWKNRETLERGYAPVHQQARGTDRSEGVCLVYENERRDGLDTLEWIRRLPHYNGEIFLYGASYCASVHWSYLDTDPPDVKGAWLAVQDVNRYNIHYRNGNFKIALHGAWSDIMHKKNDRTLRRDPSVRFTDLPLKGYTVRKFGEYVPGLEASWEHPRPADPWWRTDGAAGGEYRRALLDSHMPVMLTTGFYDIYTEGIFDMWRELPSARRANCALVADEGDHVTRHPDIDSSCAWFDHCRGAKNALRLVRPGRTTWREVWGDGWRSAEEMTDGELARTFSLGADRSLSEGSVQDGEVAFAYDPSHPPAFSPVGCLTFGGLGVQPGPDWATGVVSFVSSPFDAACHVQGRMRLRLAVKSDCDDTAFYVRINVWRNDEGRWYNLRDDIKTICWDHPDYSPGTEVDVDYLLSDHAFAIRPGDRIRVDVAGASPAQFVPHTNFRGPFHEQSKSRIARNTILAGRSRLVLPIGVGERDKKERRRCP